MINFITVRTGILLCSQLPSLCSCSVNASLSHSQNPMGLQHTSFPSISSSFAYTPLKFPFKTPAPDGKGIVGSLGHESTFSPGLLASSSAKLSSFYSHSSLNIESLVTSPWTRLLRHSNFEPVDVSPLLVSQNFDKLGQILLKIIST